MALNITSKDLAQYSDSQLQNIIAAKQNELKFAKQGTVGYTNLTDFINIANQSLASRAPAAPTTSMAAKVDAFNSAFSQPSLLSAPTLDSAGLSAGDRLALSTQYQTSTPKGTWSGNTDAPTSRTIDQQNADFEAFMASAPTTPQVAAFGDMTAVNQAKQAELQNNMNVIQAQQAAQSAQDAVKATQKAATTGIDLGKATTEDTLRTRIKRGIAATIATKGTLASPLLEKPTLLG